MLATVIVHWPGKSTAACPIHALKLHGLAGVLGFALTTTPVESEKECDNCANEAKKSESHG